MSGFGDKLRLLESVDSTNTQLKLLARQGAEHGTIIAARSQSAGRGRLGRSFASPESGLYMSVLLRPECEPERLPTLTPAAAVAVCRAIEKLCGISAGIKWPNDLLVEGRKLCGILTEGVQTPDGSYAAVVGIGVNVNTRTEALPEELRDTACSVLEITGRETELEALALAIAGELESVYRSWLRGDVSLIEEYRRLCVTPGREVLVLREGAGEPAFAEGIGDDYSLLVRYPDGRLTPLSFGEVSIRYGHGTNPS